MTRTLVSLFLVCCLAACGGGGSSPAPPGTIPPPQAAQTSGSPLARPLAMVLPAMVIPLSPAQLMDWAEIAYPGYFPAANRTDGFQEPYTYRHYHGVDNYLGVSTGTPSDVAIYIYGNLTNWQLVRVAALADYTCTVLPARCTGQHQVTVSAQTMTVNLATSGTQVINLVRSGATAAVPITSVKDVIWNSQCKGWLGAGGSGARVPFVNNTTTIGGLASSDRGLISVVTHDGLEYFVNLDNVAVSGAVIRNGGIWYGDTTSAAITCPS